MVQLSLEGQSSSQTQSIEVVSEQWPASPPVLVRLRARNGLCWGGNYSVPARNGRRRFSSRGDFYYPHAPAR